jgi:hypothetical protein
MAVRHQMDLHEHMGLGACLQPPCEHARAIKFGQYIEIV